MSLYSSMEVETVKFLVTETDGSMLLIVEKTDGSLRKVSVKEPDGTFAPAMFPPGLLADRPAASPDNAGKFYFATDKDGGTLYRSNGVSWVQQAPGVQFGQDTEIEYNGVLDSKEGAPVRVNTPGFSSSYTFVDGAVNSVTGQQKLPSRWNTYNVDFIWTVPIASSGQARLQFGSFWSQDGDDLTAISGVVNISVNDDVPALGIRKRTRVATGVAVQAGKTHTFRCRRDGVADSCNTSISFVRPVFSRES